MSISMKAFSTLIIYPFKTPIKIIEFIYNMVIRKILYENIHGITTKRYQSTRMIFRMMVTMDGITHRWSLTKEKLWQSVKSYFRFLHDSLVRDWKIAFEQGVETINNTYIHIIYICINPYKSDWGNNNKIFMNNRIISSITTYFLNNSIYFYRSQYWYARTKLMII